MNQKIQKKPLIGFVGQGYVGGSNANNLEKRGYDVVRYSLEQKYIQNKDRIKECDIVFVCVPTPTTPKGFDYSVVAEGISLVAPGKIAVVKSTLLPGTTKNLQKKFPKTLVFCSPEFLSVVTAQQDADSPFSNIIGMAKKDGAHEQAAQEILSILPPAPFSLICDSTEAEMIKYTHNANGYFQVLFGNIMYDLARAQKCDWDVIHSAMKADPYIPKRYTNPIHQSGRGAGGLCFIKDFAALRGLYKQFLPNDKNGFAVLRSLEQKNIELLQNSKKDLDLLVGVYGKGIDKKKSKNNSPKTR